MSNIKYSVFRYTPSFITAESIILGILIDVDENINFFHSNNYRRITEFDDELELDYVKTLLKNLESEFSSNLCNTSEMIFNKTRHFVNEFSFDSIIEMNDIDDTDQTIEQLRKLYLKYDYDKKDRLTKSKEFRLINQILRGKKIDYSHNAKVVGNFSENITYDYIIGNYGVKFFSFNKKDLSKSITSIKSWAWNCKNNKNIETVFIYHYDSDTYPENKTQVDVLLEILKSSTDKVYNIENGLKFVGSFATN